MTKKLLLIIIFISNYGFICKPANFASWSKIGQNTEYAEYDLRFTPYQKNTSSWNTHLSRSVTVRAIKFSLSSTKLIFHSSGKTLACETSKKDTYIQKLINDSPYRNEIISAVNSNFYHMPYGPIQGVAYDGINLWNDDFRSQSISSSGIIAIKNNQFEINPRDSYINILGPVLHPSQLSEYDLILQAYPLLIKDNEIIISDRVKEDKRSRTIIAYKENTGYLITLDARGENNLTGMSLWELAHFLNNSQCGIDVSNALNLDGGGSTAIAIPSLNFYAQADRCRSLGNILILKSK